MQAKLRNIAHDSRTQVVYFRPCRVYKRFQIDKIAHKCLAVPPGGLEYSAGDDPGSRKNPELYGQLKVTKFA
jgi:hypothetical protein